MILFFSGGANRKAGRLRRPTLAQSQLSPVSLEPFPLHPRSWQTTSSTSEAGQPATSLTPPDSTRPPGPRVLEARPLHRVTWAWVHPLEGHPLPLSSIRSMAHPQGHPPWALPTDHPPRSFLGPPPSITLRRTLRVWGLPSKGSNTKRVAHAQAF